MTTITCKIPEGLHAQLQAQAKQQRVSKSSIVREAIDWRLKQGSKRAAPRALDLVADLAGSLRGPRHLSTNPKYMENMGA